MQNTHTRGCLHLHLEDTLTRSLTRFEPTKLKNKHLKDTKTTGTWMLAHTFFTGETCLPNLRVCSCIVLTCLVTAIISEQLLIKQCRGSTVLMSLSNRQDEATWPGLMWEVWLLAVGVFFQSLFTVLCLWEWFLIKVFFFFFLSMRHCCHSGEGCVCVCDSMQCALESTEYPHWLWMHSFKLQPLPVVSTEGWRRGCYLTSQPVGATVGDGLYL